MLLVYLFLKKIIIYFNVYIKNINKIGWQWQEGYPATYTQNKGRVAAMVEVDHNGRHAH